jgi:hypothetical protein
VPSRPANAAPLQPRKLAARDEDALHAETALSAGEVHLLWHQLAQDQALPDTYELTEHGELVMSPKPTNRHQLLCAEVAFQLRARLGGKAVVEATVLTVPPAA